jgi:glutamate synthase domain-containing protein 3
VEGTGDHGCEYMTGGIVVVLGGVGRNFAAGMSGGIAYVLDEAGTFRERHASSLLEIAAIGEQEDRATLHALIERHARLTGSRRARHVLSHWNVMARRFVRVMSFEYKEAIAGARSLATLGMTKGSIG